MATSIVSNNTAATFGNSPQKTGEPVDRLSIYSGKALEFDGVSDYLDTNFEISADANATPNLDHTIAIWVKLNAGDTNMALFTSRKTAGSSNVGTGLEVKSNNKAKMAVQSGTSKAEVEGTTNFADLQWHRVVGVCDRSAGTIKIYVDGALEGTTSSVLAGSESHYNNREMGIGVFDVTLVSGLSGYFNGLLCDAQLWHKCWSEDDVRYDYLNPEKLITDNASVTTGITASDLKLWYPMNDTGITNPQTVVFDGANTGGLESTITPHLNDDGNFNGNNWSITAGDTGDWTGHTSSQTSMTLTKNGTDTGDLRLNLQSSINSGMSSDLQAGAYYKFTHTVSTTSSLPSWQFRINHGSGTTTRIYEGTNNVIYFTAESASVYIQVRSNTDGENFTLSNISLAKVKQPFHATTTFLGDELAVNGDFESSIAFANADDSWYDKSVNSDQNLTGSADTSDQRNGSQCLKLTLDGSTSGHIAYFRDDYEVGKTYKVLFFMKKATSGTVRIGASTLLRSFTVGDTGSQTITSSYTEFSTTFTATNESMRVNINIAATDGDVTFMDDFSIKEVGIATGWTDADQQQYIPQTAFMDGCVKLLGPTIITANTSPHYTLDSTGTTTSGTAYSVSAWLMRTTTPGATDNYLIGHLAADRIYFASSTQVFWKTDDTGTTINLGVTLEANVWEFWTFVSDGGTKRIYRNAQELVTSSQSPSNGFDYSRIGVRLGQESATGFEGIIDELAVWDTVLSPTEVTELYNNGLPLNATKHSKYTTSASNLKAYWKNNHLNSEGKMKDQVGSNHATITETGDSFEKIFFQQGVTANLCTQGYSNNIVHPSKGAIHFLGQEYAQFPGERIINLDGDFTIEFWFKKTEIHGAELTDGMLFRSGNNQIRIPTGVSSGKMSSIKYRDASSGSVTMAIHSDNRKSIYEWSHIAFVRESGTLKIYIDTATTGNDTLSTTGQMQISLIGAYSISAGQVYKGFLDDLRVYDKALSAKEITKNYKNGKSQHKN